ncbi:hypothetical protein AAFF_G00207150 [Aldrovandia affinis]|uniref:Uncharacterized protein n=1 Tax=Aldrovandia affinis TaxID=143900 RepID=A0AAD7W659_9TELE|nr:hypothetical protein AAFF_G00207150 [Aldrovandia affinis]
MAMAMSCDRKAGSLRFCHVTSPSPPFRRKTNAFLRRASCTILPNRENEPKKLQAPEHFCSLPSQSEANGQAFDRNVIQDPTRAAWQKMKGS